MDNNVKTVIGNIKNATEKLMITAVKIKSELKNKYRKARNLKVWLILFSLTAFLIASFIIPPRTIRVLLSGNAEILENSAIILNSDKLKVHFIDCGQGDAIFIEYADFKVLVDSGPSKSSYEVFSYVHALTDNITFHIITHGHEDHCGGTKDLIKGIKIGEVLIPPMREVESLPGVLETCKESGIPVSEVKAGNSIKYKEITIDFLAPSLNTYANENNSSIVFSLKFGETDFLFTGDLELSGDRLKPYKYEVIKAGHHGSATSTDSMFLDIFSPSLFVISCGLNNKFSHPSKEVINLLKEKKIPYLRTDLNGTIVLSSNGRNIDFASID